MELDQWKDIWQAEPTAGAAGDRQRLRDLLEKKSVSPVSRMKRNLNIELWLILLTYGSVILYYLIAFGGRMFEISGFMLGVGAVFVVYYLRKRKVLREMECLSCQVKQNLEKQLTSLEKYIRFYLLGGTALIPAALLYFGWVLFRKAPYVRPDNPFFPAADRPWGNLVLAWALLILVLTVAMYFVNKWYVGKLYGQHVEKLRKILREMEGED